MPPLHRWTHIHVTAGVTIQAVGTNALVCVSVTEIPSPVNLGRTEKAGIGEGATAPPIAASKLVKDSAPAASRPIDVRKAL